MARKKGKRRKPKVSGEEGNPDARSGIHLTAEDSGFPVADPEKEPGPVKDGSGDDPHPSADEFEGQSRDHEGPSEILTDQRESASKS